MMEVGANGQQQQQQTREPERGGDAHKKTEAKKPEIVYDLVQVWVENTALRNRVNELEGRMEGLERTLRASLDQRNGGGGGRPRA